MAGLAAYKGVAQLISDGRARGYVLNDSLFIFLGRGRIAGLPMMIWILILVALALHVLLKYTDIGRNIYAIGGNDTAARLAGIDINKYLVSVYALIGVVAAVAGILLAVALLGALENGLTVQGINSFWQNVAQGALLVVAVAIQQRRSGERAVGLPA